MVILHQFERGKHTPSISPFPLKLETYLRMTGIPYEVWLLIEIFDNGFLTCFFHRMNLKSQWDQKAKVHGLP